MHLEYTRDFYKKKLDFLIAFIKTLPNDDISHDNKY